MTPCQSRESNSAGGAGHVTITSAKSTHQQRQHAALNSARFGVMQQSRLIIALPKGDARREQDALLKLTAANGIRNEKETAAIPCANNSEETFHEQSGPAASCAFIKPVPIYNAT